MNYLKFTSVSTCTQFELFNYVYNQKWKNNSTKQNQNIVTLGKREK